MIEVNRDQQEVVVTDIHMPFGSMVTFMVKWAIASIPAMLILIFLAAGTWALTIGFVGSLGHRATHESAAPSGDSNTDANSGGSSSEQAAYIGNLMVRNVKVGESTLGEKGVWGEIKNNGGKSLKEVEITIYCLGSDNKPVFEKTYNPVLVTDLGFGDESKPLKPGYTRTFGVRLNDAPSDWHGKVDVRVTKVEFQE